MSGIKRVVLTGGPGTGKTSVLELLAERGYKCLPEVPREIILEQQALKNGILPQNDFGQFARLVYDRMLLQYQRTRAKVTFFDRAIPDIVAYLYHAGVPLPFDIEMKALSCAYYHKIFVFPPWEVIYSLDGVRYESFEDSIRIDEKIRYIYQAFGYKIVEVLKTTPQERVKFILEQIEDDRLL